MSLPAFGFHHSCSSSTSHPTPSLPDLNRIVSDDEINITMEWIETMEKKTVKVKKTNTINEVKQIFIKSGISPSLPKLYYNGRVLEKELTLFYYKVEDNSIIVVETNMMSPYARLLHINLPRKSKSDKPVTVKIYASEADTISKVTSMVFQKEEIEPAGRYHMMQDGRQLCDSQTLAQNQVTNNATLSLVPVPKDCRSIQFTTCYNETYPMEVVGANLIGNLRSVVAAMSHSEYDGSQLFQGNTWLRDNRTIGSYNFKDNDTIYIKAKITIHVKRLWMDEDDDLLSIRIYPTDCVGEVTTQVVGKSHERYSLRFNNIVLDETRPVMSYGIRVGSVLTMGAATDQ